MLFGEFAIFLEKISAISGRNQMMETLADFLKKVPSTDVQPMMYLLQGRLVPAFIPLEFGMSQKLVLRAISQLSTSPELPQKLFAKLGDVGLVVEEIVANQVTSRLTLAQVYDSLLHIARLGGKGSQEGKLDLVKKLLLQLDPLSAKFVTRIIVGSLRLGLSDKTVLDALSWALMGGKSLRPQLDVAYGARADIGVLAKLVLSTPLEKVGETLSEIELHPGYPVASKLVEREKNATSIFLRLGECIVQPKLDGLRCQIHLLEKANEAGNRVEIFSRNMESLTAMFPDIVQAAKSLAASSFIIDSEVVGFDLDTGEYLPFQTTIQRRRKYDVAKMADDIPVKAMAFDLLYLDGDDLSRLPLQRRISMLERLLAGDEQPVIEQLETQTVSSADLLEDYFMKQVTAGLEGVIVKKFNTAYDPGTRNFDWIKLKASAKSEMVDTVDAVVIGYFHGRGSRAKFGVGALLLAVYSPQDDSYYSVAKLGTGMTDEQLRQIKHQLSSLEINEPLPNVSVEKLLYPDVWVYPKIVVEVEADQITRSPGHTAAQGLPVAFEQDTLTRRGLSLRFPRMKVWGRDKQPQQATTVSELLRMYELRMKQKQRNGDAL